MLKVLNNILLILLFFISQQTGIFASEILKYENQDGNYLYTNIETNKNGLKNAEIIKTSTTPRPQDHSDINYQLENLFNDKNTDPMLLSNLRNDRNDLLQILYNFEQQLKKSQFELNETTINLERCYVNPVYAYLILFCSGLETKKERILYQIDLIYNNIDNIRYRLNTLDHQIVKINSQNKSEVCTVHEIINGNNFICAFGKGYKIIRLIGIETPDSTAEYLESLLLGKKVLLRFDDKVTDINNNLLAYVFIDDTTMLNAMLLRQGMGMALSNYEYKYIYEFKEYEKLAKESKSGIWSD